MLRRSLLVVLALGALAFANDNPIAAFHKKYESGDADARLAAVNELGKIQSANVVAALANAVQRDSSPAVRRAAAKALGAQWASAQAAQVLAKALHAEGDPADVQLAIVEALGETGCDLAVPPLLRLLKVRPRVYAGGMHQAKEISDATVPVLEALRRCQSAEATGDLVDYLSAEEPGAQPRGRRAVRALTDPNLLHAFKTLNALTGESHKTPEEWQDWWAQNKGSLKTVAVYRCERTGEIFDKPSGKLLCPKCGVKECCEPLRTRYANVPMQAQPDTAATKRKKKGE
jgi:hypothetical protein